MIRMSRPITGRIMKAIHEKCIDCCGGQVREVKFCPIKDCPLYPYRMGHDPFRKRKANL